MKEILEELIRAIINPLNDQVYYKYEEKEMADTFGVERHFFILEMSRYSNSIKKIVFKKASVQTQLGLELIKLDYAELLRKEFLLEVIKYGVFSALNNLDNIKEV